MTARIIPLPGARAPRSRTWRRIATAEAARLAELRTETAYVQAEEIERVIGRTIRTLAEALPLLDTLKRGGRP